MTCIGICTRYKAIRPATVGGLRYSMGQKRCQICEIFLYVEGLYCPCCKYRLRTKPRLSKARLKLLEIQRKGTTIGRNN
ncbi:MAG: hypothetical protein DLM72_15255 [Candidatus Nitrosopolaris wilkensis]|nr:MAG: hypothetical protein DLM72_15255 [Candidatus Nitrosopolaris wilkensis]